MQFLPPRRWLQFRLSTWFVLVAILGWAMASRPWLIEVQHVPPFEPWYLPNPFLALPALTLAAFLAWNAAWALFGRFKKPADSPL
ncbi:MAG: hypothetical protein K2Y37_13610 [Pirellulales bacterium]|nr:hypothetical protein [Pirellulales bacterium]